MAYKIYTKSNYFYINDTSDDLLYEGLSKNVRVRRKLSTSDTFFFDNVNSFDKTREVIFADIQDENGNPYADLQTFVSFYEENTGKSSPQAGGQVPFDNLEIVNQSNYQTKLANIDPNKHYLIDGVIDLGTFTIQLPDSNISMSGYSFDTSGLISSEDNYIMFNTNKGSGARNIVMSNLFISVTGVNSKVYNVSNSTFTSAVELSKVNYNNCTSLGVLSNYRQILEEGTGRFGGTPELELLGVMNGVRISTSIVRGISDITSLFKKGASLTFSGRFVTDINCDLPANGSLIDFDETNITNDESLILDGCYITRQGVLNSNDSNIVPNISETSTKSFWSDNTGIPNTTKYIRANITTEITTPIASQGVYFPLLGTYQVAQESHFESVNNGEFKLLSGNGTYKITGDYILDSNQNNQVFIRVTKSIDGGVTFPEEINHISRTINSLQGGRDVGFFPINFIANLKKNDILRVEVQNASNSNNITAELDSYVTISNI